MSLSSVATSLNGLIRTHDGLQLLTERNCITRQDNNPSDGRVKLISGGGSGHEPAHAGYVGHGMLTGAVCGNIFSSPSVTAILDCLRTVVDPEGGAIFVVKNYTGDRLNFGIALERSLALGYRNVRMLLVGEDCSIEEKDVRKSVGKRGLAGVVLVHKVLGAMAEEGCGVEEMMSFGEGLVENMATIGFTFEQKGGSLENIEIGKGIHGEPGVFTLPSCEDFGPIVDFLAVKLGLTLKMQNAHEVLLLVNNLGGTSEFVMGIFMESLLDKIGGFFKVKRVYCGTFLSSLDQTGVSITVLNLGYSPKLLEYLDYEVTVPSMLFGRKHSATLQPSTAIQVTPVEVLNPQKTTNAFTVTEKFGAKLTSTILTFVCEALISCTDMLNTIDKEAGDGDTGSTIGKGAAAILKQLQSNQLDLLHPAQLLQQISVILEQDMGGSSGALYSLFFQGASKIFLDPTEPGEVVTIRHWASCLSNGNDTIVKYALTELGDRTMLDPLREGELRLKRVVDQGTLPPVLDCVEQFTKGCEESARATQHMVPKSGRAAYGAASETPKVYKHPDPGAHAVAIWARALLEACKQVIVD